MTDAAYADEPNAEQNDANIGTTPTVPTAVEPDVGPAFLDSRFGIARKLAKTQARQNKQRPIAISSDTEYETLPPGQTYIADGQTRVKAYPVASDEEYEAVPEGSIYTTPDGTTRRKPVPEGVGYSAQTLHSMAVTDKERRKVLERFYPGMVEEDSKGLFVREPNGIVRRPGRLDDVGSWLGVLGGNAAPVGLSVVGGLLAAPVAGPAGAAGGGMLGSIAGDSFNAAIMQLHGLYDRTPGEDAANKTINAGLSAAGDVVGRGVAAVVPSIKAGTSRLKTLLPDAANYFLGTDAQAVGSFKRITELGEGEKAGIAGMKGSSTAPGVSTFAPGAPYLQLLQENLHEGFTTEGTRKMAAERAYEKMATPFLEKKGIGVDDLIEPVAAPSGQRAGEMLLAKGMERAQKIDAEFAQALAERHAAAKAGIAPQMAQRETLARMVAEKQKSAKQLIDTALDDIDRSVEQTLRANADGENTGELWNAVGRRFMAVKSGIGTQYRAQANAAYATIPEEALVPTAPLVDSARALIDEMPPEFAARNPSLIRRIEALGKRVDPETREPIPPPDIPFQEIHRLRTDLREAADWYDLPSNFKNGALKAFAGETNAYMQHLGRHPAFNEAMDLLNATDAWYAREIKAFNSRELKAVVRGLENGEPADPEKLFQAIVKSNQTDLTKRISEIVGPNLWTGVRAAQQSRWLQAAREGRFDNTLDAAKFAKEVLAAEQDGTLAAVQGRERAAQLSQLARQIATLEGDLPVTFRPGDSALQVFRDAREAALQVEAQVSKDPVRALEMEMRKMAGQSKQARAAARKADPLGFLEDASFGANRAVNKILGDEDLIYAVMDRYGQQSPEFKALQAAWIERVFKGNLNPGEKMAKYTEATQLRMLGTDIETARRIADDMKFIMSGRALSKRDGTGEGMMVVSKLTNPVAGAPGVVSQASKLVPGANFAARAARQSYYEIINRMLESPSFARFLERSYAGGAESRQAVRNYLAEHMQRGGAMGVGAAALTAQTRDEDLSLPPRKQQ